MEKQAALLSCEHKEIVMANTTGLPLGKSSYAVDFVIRCHTCNEELFRISEHQRTITNLSKH